MIEDERVQMLHRIVVAALAIACEAIDAVLYKSRSRGGRKLALSWNCRLAHLSASLDRKWKTSYWAPEMIPGPTCGICCFRPSSFELGRDPRTDKPFLVCAWCETKLDWSDFNAALAEARLRSL